MNAPRKTSRSIYFKLRSMPRNASQSMRPPCIFSQYFHHYYFFWEKWVKIFKICKVRWENFHYEKTHEKKDKVGSFSKMLKARKYKKLRRPQQNFLFQLKKINKWKKFLLHTYEMLAHLFFSKKKAYFLFSYIYEYAIDPMCCMPFAVFFFLSQWGKINKKCSAWERKGEKKIFFFFFGDWTLQIFLYFPLIVLLTNYRPSSHSNP